MWVLVVTLTEWGLFSVPYFSSVLIINLKDSLIDFCVSTQPVSLSIQLSIYKNILGPNKLIPEAWDTHAKPVRTCCTQKQANRTHTQCGEGACVTRQMSRKTQRHVHAWRSVQHMTQRNSAHEQHMWCLFERPQCSSRRWLVSRRCADWITLKSLIATRLTDAGGGGSRVRSCSATSEDCCVYYLSVATSDLTRSW